MRELTVVEAAEFLDAGEEIVIDLLNHHTLPARFERGVWLIPLAALQQFKESDDAI